MSAALRSSVDLIVTRSRNAIRRGVERSRMKRMTDVDLVLGSVLCAPQSGMYSVSCR